MFVVEAAFLWLLLRRRGDAKTAHKDPDKDSAATTLLKEQPTKELGAAQQPPARALVEPLPGSITEHTTRDFEPVYSKRKGE
jgi:hypothetical protein